MSEFSTDPVVLVMGITGVGKSTFISKLIGCDVGVGHDLTSCTKGIKFHSMMIKNRPLYLVDTPGFDDTYRSDFEIFSEIAFILSQLHRQGKSIAGILYLHRISDNRVSGTAMRNLKLLEAMCGLDAAPRMFLVTTMWDLADEHLDEAASRESRLVTEMQFWGRFIQQGSQARRWRGSEGSALSIVDDLLSLENGASHSPLTIQRELIDDNKSLRDTTAGQQLMLEYTAAEKGFSREIQLLQSDESVSQHESQASLLELKGEIMKMKHAQNKLHVSTQDLFIERERSYRKILSKMRDEQRMLFEDLQEQRRQYQQLKDEMKSNDKFRADEKDYWSQKRAKLEHQVRTGRRRRDSVEKEYQKIQEEESLENEHLNEFQLDNDMKMSQVSQGMLELRKRDMLKRNLLPFLGFLAGVGLTAAGAATGLIPLAGAGVGLTVSSASGIRLSRKIQHDSEVLHDSNSRMSFVSNSSTTALNGAQISNYAFNDKS